MRPTNTRGLGFTLTRDFDPFEEKQWLIDGLLGQGDLSAFFGEPGATKSVLAVDLACHVALGRPWFGREVKQSGVLYIACERGGTIRRRIRAFLENQDGQTVDIPLAVTDTAIDLRSAEGADRVCWTVWEAADAMESVNHDRFEINLVIVDTLSRALAGGDENGSADMGELVRNIDRIQRHTGCHVCLIHHPPLNGEARMRGHTALTAAMDTTVHVVKKKHGSIATVMKNNDGPTGDKFHYTLKSVVTQVDRSGTKVITVPIVVPAFGNLAGMIDDPRPKKAASDKTLKGATQSVLDALTAVVADQGSDIPASEGAPAGQRGAPEAAWRSRCYLDKGSMSGTPAACKKRFQRARDELLKTKLAGTSGEWFWVADQRDNPLVRDKETMSPTSGDI